MPTVIVNGEFRCRVNSQDSRASMVRSAASLIGSRGVSATSFSDVLADSGAPRGSIYHHFPDGKKQLAQDAVPLDLRSGPGLSSGRTPGQRPSGVLERFIGMWRHVVVSPPMVPPAVWWPESPSTPPVADRRPDRRLCERLSGPGSPCSAEQLQATGLSADKRPVGRHRDPGRYGGLADSLPSRRHLWGRWIPLPRSSCAC